MGLIAKTGTNPTKLGLVVDKTTQRTNTEPGSGGIARAQGRSDACEMALAVPLGVQTVETLRCFRLPGQPPTTLNEPSWT